MLARLWQLKIRGDKSIASYTQKLVQLHCKMGKWGFAKYSIAVKTKERRLYLQACVRCVYAQISRTCLSQLCCYDCRQLKIFYDSTCFVIDRISVNIFVFLVIYLKALHLTCQNDWLTESLSDKWSSWLDIVRWSAIILSPGYDFFVLIWAFKI